MVKSGEELGEGGSDNLHNSLIADNSHGLHCDDNWDAFSERVVNKIKQAFFRRHLRLGFPVVSRRCHRGHERAITSLGKRK